MSASEERIRHRIGLGITGILIATLAVLAVASLIPATTWASDDPHAIASGQEHSVSENSAHETPQSESGSSDSNAKEAEKKGDDDSPTQDAGKAHAPSSITLAPSTETTAPPLSASGNEQSVSIAWRDTGDNMISIESDGSLHVDITDSRIAGVDPLIVGTTVEWASSGSTDFEPGEVEVRIPDHLFMARDGEPYETVYELLHGTTYVPRLKVGFEVELGVPEAPRKSADGWQYRHDEEAHEVIITNADRIGAGTKLVCEVNYVYDASWHQNYGCENDGLRHPVFTELTNEPVYLYAEAEGAGRSQIGPAAITTRNVLQSMAVEAAGMYDSWQPAWGDAPEGDEGSLYIVWEATAAFDHFYQPFSLELAPADLDRGEIVGMVDTWMLGSPDNIRGDFDPNACAFEAPADADLNLEHLDVYAAAAKQDISVRGLTASFAALVRYDKASLDSAGAAVELVFPAHAALESLDYRDAQTAKGSGSFTYQPLGFDAPPGNEFDLRMNRGAPDLVDSSAYYSLEGQIERLASGQRTAPTLNTSSMYASCFKETLGEGLDPSKVESYGKRPYTVELVDDFAYIEGRLDASEHEMTRVLDINAAAVMLYEGVPDYQSGSYAVKPIEGAIDPLEVTISVKTGDDGSWMPAARWTQTTSGRLDPTTIEPLAGGVEVRAFDPADTMGSWANNAAYDDRLSEYDGAQRYDLTLPAGTTAVKLGFETCAWAASVGDVEPGHSDPRFGLTVASEYLPSERLQTLAAQSERLWVYRANTLAAHDSKGAHLGFEGTPNGFSQNSPQAEILGERDRALYGALMYHDTTNGQLVRADPNGSMLGFALKQENDTVGKKVDFGYVYAEVLFETQTREDDSAGLPASVQPPETSGTFYLLLPPGFSADTSTLGAAERLSGGDPYMDSFDTALEGGVVRDRRSAMYLDEDGAWHNTYEYSPLADVTSVESFPNWRDSGRELLKVGVRTSPESKGYSPPYAVPGGQDRYASGFILSFGGHYSWDAIADYGSTPRFRFAYESGNEDMSAWGGKPNAAATDIGSSEASTVGNDWSDEEKGLLAGLDGDASSQPRWLYAKTTPTINFPTSAEYGLQLSAKASDDAVWTSAGDTAEEVQVYAGTSYAYRIRTALEEGSTATGNVIFDAIECYAPDGEQPGWRGTLEYVDTSALVSRGIDPVVYYSATPDLDLSDEGNRNLGNAELWSTDPPDDLSQVTAVAVDCSRAEDGSPFELQGNESLVVTLGMRAPGGDGSSAPQGVTYNQAWLASTMTSATGVSSEKVLHHEATVVRIEEMTLTLLKADAEGISKAASSGTVTVDDAHQLEGARFELYRYDGEGEPDGTLIEQGNAEGWTFVGAATSNPRVEFTGLAPGTYRLVETQAPLGYRRPTGQWAITLDPLLPHQASIEAVPGPRGDQPPAFAIAKTGEWIVPNITQPTLPITGAAGALGFMGLGMAALIIGFAMWTLRARGAGSTG